MPTVLRERDQTDPDEAIACPDPSISLSYEGTMQSQFTAVVTTGIYCREGCGGRPLRRNTRPYTFAAAAEADGFRPCLQCRPDREPEPGWVDAPELVCRALRLIADGALDSETEDEFATRQRTIVGVAYWFPHQGNVTSALMLDYDGQSFDNFVPALPKQQRIALHALINF